MKEEAEASELLEVRVFARKNKLKVNEHTTNDQALGAQYKNEDKGSGIAQK